MSWSVRVVRDRYADSVRLMTIAQHARAQRASTAPRSRWARRRTCEALDALGVRCDAGPADVVIAVDAAPDAAEAALDGAERELGAAAAGRRRAPTAEPPRSAGAAARRSATRTSR